MTATHDPDVLAVIYDTLWVWRFNIDGLDDCALLGYSDGRVRFHHRCDRGARGVIICAPSLSPGHDVRVTARDITTPGLGLMISVSPSILCNDCGTHGFIAESAWRSA